MFVAHFLVVLPIAAATKLYSTYEFNPLEHLTGVAPYFEPQNPPLSPGPPRKCTPVRAAYLSRHAAIYINDFDYESYIEPFINKWKNHTNIDWSLIPTLNFLADWSPPFSDAEEEILTRVGKLEATELGVKLTFRYPNLKLPQRVWAASAERTVKSAQALVRGLQLRDGTINVVPVYEGEQAGADTLAPSDACPRYQGSAGSKQSAQFRDVFTRPIIARLKALAPGFNFTAYDVYGMMELCGYEAVVKGSSPFCNLDLFTPDDWLGFEYAEDIRYHYNTGYGSPYSGVIGLPWVRASTDLLMGDSGNEQDMYISFAHRALPPTIVVAMGLFNNSEFGGSALTINDTMPLDRINHRRAWKSSHILPFLGNIAIERLNCSGSYGYSDGDYYRVLVNNAPQQLPGCGDGPGTSCSRQKFQEYIQGRVDLFGGFSEKCGVDYGNSTDVLDIYTDPSVGNGTAVTKRGRRLYNVWK
ncbi:putative histidine acid protein [Cladorrhinum samala]|uniref:Histidine acid protein n=1 Tax=Cladorrhinum samala TaxID=585594 RepID=A0AAV9HD46_9PEZI|nr:putative histidine acid protein [Cladorrhinum samala]